MTKEEAANAVGELASKMREGHPHAAVVLNTLAGAMFMGVDCEEKMSDQAAEFSRKMLDAIGPGEVIGVAPREQGDFK